jgi:hypothetical protein
VGPAVEAENIVGELNQPPAFDVSHSLTHGCRTLEKKFCFCLSLE